MFAKGPRFPPEKPSEAPGPGHYKLPEDFRYDAYKKGAFLEKSERFGTEKEFDIPGPGTYNTAPRDSNPRPGPSKLQSASHGLTHLQQQMEILKSQNARLQKEHQQAIQKYEEKVSHQESTIKSLVKDNVTLQSQVSTQQKEYRTVYQREMALKSALEKTEAAHKGEADRAIKLAGLQRKLQDVEKSHADDKRKHQTELEPLKNELDISRKASAEQTERLAHLRKQYDISESRAKDLKKAIIADQAEIKDLRAKLRGADQVRTQAASRQGEVDQLRKALHSAEAKCRSELHDKDTKLSEQDRSLAAERIRREAVEQQAALFKSKADVGLKEAGERIRRLEDELELVRGSAEEVGTAALESKKLLDNTRTTLARVAEEYGRLATSSISLAAHRRIQLQNSSLQLRNIRLDRRLADREALIEQLTDYCRQASGEKAFLASLLREAEEDHRILLRDRTPLDEGVPPEDTFLMRDLLNACDDAGHLRSDIAQSDTQSAQVMASFYQVQFEDLLVSYAMAHGEGVQQSAVASRLADAASELHVEVNTLRLTCRTAEAELATKSTQITEAVTRERGLAKQLATLKGEAEELAEALRKERGSRERLAQNLHQCKKNEELLRLEVDERRRLAEDLIDVTRYKEAHADLLTEVVELIQRNELAEAEAERLGKFNAEILGHTNPQQKILYVDKIRRDLAETKHRLMQSTRNREELAADNAALQHEVAAYKSVAVPIELKPRSNRVRIERAPLASRSVNELGRSITFELTPPPDEEPIDTLPMTLDEIM